MTDTQTLVTFNKLKMGLAQAENALQFYVLALKEYEHLKRKMESHIESLKFELGKLHLEEEAEPVNINPKDNGRNQEQEKKRPKGKEVSLS